MEYIENGERVFHARERATWDTLVRGRATTVQDLERARRRGWTKASARHTERLVRYNLLLRLCASLMQETPAKTLAEACASLTGPPLRVVK
jgi:hypothetical protein